MHPLWAMWADHFPAWKGLQHCQVQSLLNKVCPENMATIVEKISAVQVGVGKWVYWIMLVWDASIIHTLWIPLVI